MHEFVSKNIRLASDKRRELHINKHKYCVFKNDLVLCTNKALFPSENNRSTSRQNAYPAVVSNLGEIVDSSKKFLTQYYGFRNASKQMQFLHQCTINADDYFEKQFPGEESRKGIYNLPYFSAQGYALGTAWASDQTGDTVSSVLIGGMQTVMNGAFASSAGEVLQWYFEFEEDLFYPKRVQLSFNDPHQEAASRKSSAEDNATSETYARLSKWVITQNDTMQKITVWHQDEGYALLSTLANTAARDKEMVVTKLQHDANGKQIDNHGFRIPGYKDQVFTLDLDGQNKTLTDLMKTGVINRVSNFDVRFNSAGTAISESYNKGDPLRKRRREFNERMDGMGAEQKGNKAYPKPYRLCNGHDHYGDKIRIFAKCVSSARPHEMMDIMLMTQSL